MKITQHLKPTIINYKLHALYTQRIWRDVETHIINYLVIRIMRHRN